MDEHLTATFKMDNSGRRSALASDMDRLQQRYDVLEKKAPRTREIAAEMFWLEHEIGSAWYLLRRLEEEQRLVG